MKMLKRLLNRKNVEKLSHQRFVKNLTRNIFSQKYGLHNFAQNINKISHAKFQVFLFRIFRPSPNKNKYYPNLKFEFGLPLFFLRTLRILPGKNRLVIQSKNDLVNFIQFINKITFENNIQPIQKYHPTEINSEKLIPIYHKSEQNLISPGVFPSNSIFKELNQSHKVVFNQQFISTSHVLPKPIDAVFQIHRRSLSPHVIRMAMNGILHSMKEFPNSSAPRTSISGEMTFKHLIEGKWKALNSIKIITRDGIFQSVNANLVRKSPKTTISDVMEDSRRVNKKTTVIRDIFPTNLENSVNFRGFQTPFLSTTKNVLPVLALQQKHVPGLKSVPQSFNAGVDLPDLVHRKPAEAVNEPKNEFQLATADQHTPFRMTRPQGIVESSTENQNVDIGHLTDKVMELLEQRLKTEQERRGIFI